MSQSIRLVTFDAFGTLFRVRGNGISAYVREAMRHGIFIDERHASPAFRSAYRLQSKNYPNYGANYDSMHAKLWWQEVVRETLLGGGASQHDLDRDGKFHAIFETLYTAFAHADQYEVFDDVEDTLESLRKVPGIRLGVISNSDGRTTKVLESLDLARHFDFIITSYELGAEKPEPEAFHAALHGGVHPSQALHIGDDTKRDYHGAKSAGFVSLLLDRDHSLNAADVPEADITSSLRAVLDRVEV